MMFERNFYNEHARCPKCGSFGPKPKYIPRDISEFDNALKVYIEIAALKVRGDRYLMKMANPYPDAEKLVKPDKVVCLCRCGYEWEDHEQK